MECPICGCKRVQYRSRNNKTLVTKYKCIACNQIFEITEHPVNSTNTLINQINKIKQEKKEKEQNKAEQIKDDDTHENCNHRRFTSVI